jgi:purine-binding chemotaxis protein CheW
MEQNPVNLDATWSGVSRGVYRLEDRLLVIMDIDRMLAGAGAGDAAAAA